MTTIWFLTTIWVFPQFLPTISFLFHHIQNFIKCKILNIGRMHSCIGCICLAFLHCVFSNGPSKRQNKKIYNHTDCICVTLWIFKLLASEDLKFHWLHSVNFSPLCVFKCVLKLLASVQCRPPKCEDLSKQALQTFLFRFLLQK